MVHASFSNFHGDFEEDFQEDFSPIESGPMRPRKNGKMILIANKTFSITWNLPNGISRIPLDNGIYLIVSPSESKHLSVPFRKAALVNKSAFIAAAPAPPIPLECVSSIKDEIL